MAGLNMGLFLKRMKLMGVVTGDGINVELPQINVLNGSLVSGTTVAAVETGITGLSTAAATAANVVTYSVKVPIDYDEKEDELRVDIDAAMDGSTDTPALSITGRAKTGNAASRVITFTAPTDATVSNAVTTYRFTANNQSIRAGDILSFTVAVGAHSTDALETYGISSVYRSDIVSFSDTDR